MPVRLRLLAAVPLLGAGCDTVVDPPPHPGRLPVVEALLIGGAATATFRLTWVDRETGYVHAAEPISAADVHLTLSGPSDPPSPLVSQPDSAGLFVATAAIIPGDRYRLDGTIAGRTIAATTTIPASFTVAAPAGAIEARTVGSIEPFQWRASGATVFAADHAVFGATQYHHTRDTLGAIRITPIDPSRSPELTLWAMNADAERYLYHVTAPQGNVTGGHGVLGGALVVRRPFRWQ